MARGRRSSNTPPPPPGRRERRRLETHERLYRAAMDLFAERGFLATTTEAITEAADVGQGTFFNYFPTKSHVLVALSHKQLDKLSAARQEAETGRGSIRALFHTLIHDIVRELVRSPALTRSLLTAFVSQDDVREVMSRTLANGRTDIAAVCKAGQERGEIRRDRKPADLAMTFQRNVLGTLLIWALHPRADLHAWLDRTFDDFWTVARRD